ncbi:hypothetical protein [Nostoc sp. CALU 546]|uniref:hypothetical protein n=1 Tax=Nostoc sp. CALU 546 TaxID=1867241 RepID=UPI003B66D85A
MGASSRYWKILRISSADTKLGYQLYVVPKAQQFFEEEVVNCQNGDTQAFLLGYFHTPNSTVDNTSIAAAGLCLRSYISYPILKACQKIDHLFGGDKYFTYHDLLPFVLNDDGKTQIILDSDRKTQLVIDEHDNVKKKPYKFFTIEVLRTFKYHSQSSMSLDNWAYLQTKQNSELKDFLSEFGFKHLSDWALLNKTRPKQIENLSERDRHLVEVFHTVYRRDRREQRHIEAKRCPDPSLMQLQEMLVCLQKRDIIINSTENLKRGLEQVAKQLRQYDIWTYREPLEFQDPETGNYTPRLDLPTESFNEVDVEQQEILHFLHEQLRISVVTAIEQEVSNNIKNLLKSRSYASLATKYISGLQLYYCEYKSLKEIVPLLSMTSWDQARRVLNPGKLLSNVRTVTIQQLLEKILNTAQEKGLTTIPPQPDYLKTLAEQIENFADEEVFQEAGEEIRAGKSRSLDSFYAQQLRITLAKIHQTVNNN